MKVKLAVLITAGAVAAMAGCGAQQAGSSPVLAPSAQQPSAKTASAKLPDLVGKGLQSAQDAAQAAGFYNLTSHDALGRSRHQILDRDWKVCTQTPKAGTHDTGSTLDLGAVKLDEACPRRDQGTSQAAARTTMPDFTGKALSTATKALDPSTSVDAKDASGQARVIILQSDWQVCTQAPKPGTKLTGQPVTFRAVKFGETCP